MDGVTRPSRRRHNNLQAHGCILHRRLHDERVEIGKGEAELLILLLEHALELWRAQRALLGPLHPEVATTLHDISSTISTLLGLAPAALYRAFPQWGSAALASHAEARASSLHRDIAALYDADAALPASSARLK